MIHKTAEVNPTAKLAEGVKIWNWTQVREGAKIGAETSIGTGCYIDKNVVIGENCRIQNHVDIYEGVTIGNGVFIGQGVSFTNCRHPKANENSSNGKWILEKTLVEDGVSIGANSTILPVVLARGCVIGAGAVVTKSTKPRVTYVGNPARLL